MDADKKASQKLFTFSRKERKGKPKMVGLVSLGVFA